MTPEQITAVEEALRIIGPLEIHDAFHDQHTVCRTNPDGSCAPLYEWRGAAKDTTVSEAVLDVLDAVPGLIAAIREAVAAERDRCAKIAEDEDLEVRTAYGDSSQVEFTREAIAAAIRK
jgi:hypothetical protein